MNFGFLKKFTKSSTIDDSVDSKTGGSDLLNHLSLVYENQSTPTYLINSNFELIWANKRFRERTSHIKNSKCYSALRRTSSICSNCPTLKAFRMYQPFDRFLATYEENGNVISLRVFAVPFVFEGQSYSLNFLIEKKTPKLKELEIEGAGSIPEPLENEDLLNFFMELSIPMVISDFNFNLLFANLAFKEFYPITEEILGKSLFDLGISKDKLPMDEIITHLANKEKAVFKCEMNFDRTTKPFRFNAELVPVCNKKGKEYIFCLFHPNHESDFSSSVDLELFEVISKLIENGRTGVLIFNELRQVVYQNSCAKRTINEFPELINEIIKNSQIMLKQGETPITVSNSKSERNFLVESYLVETRSRRAHYIAYLINDLTEFKRIERELNNLKQILLKVEKKTKAVLFKIDTNYKILDVVGAFYEITGIEFEEFNSKDLGWLEIVHPDDYFRVVNSFSEMFHFPNISKSLDYRIKKGNGESVWVETFVENVSDSRGKIQYLDCITFDINEQKEAEERLKSSQEEMRNLAMYFESLREEEKKKLAFEIHDELGHILTAMKLELSWVLKKKFLREDVLHEKLNKMIDMIDSMIRKVRSISSQLRPSVLDHFGITAAIEWQAKEFQKQTAIRCRLNLPKQEIQLSEAKSIAVFRVFQEILTNIARHANATRVDVHLDIEGNNLVLTVADNGKGIKPEDISAKKSLGIFGMKERARSVNGKLTISGISNIGTTVTLTIPIN